MSMQSVGERIKNRRLELKMTQEQLADVVSVDTSYIRHLEHGRRLGSIDFICKLAKALRIRPGELVDLYAGLDITASAEEAYIPSAARTMPNEYRGRIQLYVKDLLRLYDLEYTRNIDSSGNQIPSGAALEKSTLESLAEMARERTPAQPGSEIKPITNGAVLSTKVTDERIKE